MDLKTKDDQKIKELQQQEISLEQLQTSKEIAKKDEDTLYTKLTTSSKLYQVEIKVQNRKNLVKINELHQPLKL